MLDPEYLKEVPEAIAEIWEQAEDDIIKAIAEHIAKAGHSATDNQRAAVLLSAGPLGYKLSERMQKANSELNKATAEAFEEAALKAYAFERAQAGLPLDSPEWLHNITEAMIDSTCGDISNLSQTAGFRMDKAAPVTGPRASLLSAANRAMTNVASGAFTVEQEVRRATKSMAKDGLVYIDFKSGVRRHADAHLRTVIRTGLGRLSGAISERNLDEIGGCFVEVTAHLGARPSHADWQGKVYYWADRDPTGEANKDFNYPEFIDVTQYGSGPGLKGYNCRHDFFAFRPGISERAYTDEELKNIDPPPVQYKDKTYTYYEATQHQRHLERQLRAKKREIVGYIGAGEICKNDLLAAQVKMRLLSNEYKSFSKAAGIRAKTGRMQVLGYNRSISSKTVWAGRKAERRIAKNITVDDFNELKSLIHDSFGENTVVLDEVVDAVYNALDKFGGLGLYERVGVKKLGKGVVFQTVSTKYGNWSKNEFIINRERINGMTVKEIDKEFMDSKKTVCNSLEDGVYHEYIHALIASKMTFAKYERLCQTEGIKNISEVADEDLVESIAEIGVIEYHGKHETLPIEAKNLLQTIINGGL